MRVKLHQDIEGRKAGETVDVPDSRAKWLVAEGYASTSSKDDHRTGPTSVKADLDPRRAENVKGKPNDSLPEQMAAGLGTPTEPDPDPVNPPALDNPQPVERTNAKGDPAKGDAGKEKLEAAAEAAEEPAS